MIPYVNHFDVTFIKEFYQGQYFKDITEIPSDILDYYKHKTINVTDLTTARYYAHVKEPAG